MSLCVYIVNFNNYFYYFLADDSWQTRTPPESRNQPQTQSHPPQTLPPGQQPPPQAQQPLPPLPPG